MANKNVLEGEVERWKSVSLALLLLLGIVAAFSYSLMIRQKAMIQDKEIQISRMK